MGQSTVVRLVLSLGFLAAASSIGGCASGSSHADATPGAPKVVARGVNARFDLVVGQSYHLVEGATHAGVAVNLIRGREGKTSDPRTTIEQVYADPSYLHYGNEGEQPKPLCKVADQGAVGVDGADVQANAGKTTAPVQCRLPDGRLVYATAWEP